MGKGRPGPLALKPEADRRQYVLKSVSEHRSLPCSVSTPVLDGPVASPYAGLSPASSANVTASLGLFLPFLEWWLTLSLLDTEKEATVLRMSRGPV
jgi:hypothetical protein